MKIDNVYINADLIDVVQELRSQLALNQIPRMQKFKETPTHVQVSCPYHKMGQERRVSAGIRKEDGLFHCFTCREIHSLPEVISHCFGHGDIGVFGWQWLIKNFGTVEADERKPIKLDMQRSHERQNVEYVSEEELDNYRYLHPYMYKRKLTRPVIEKFDIGYDPKTQCITFPIRDLTGGTLFVARRSVKTKFFKYPKEVKLPLYGIYELSKYADNPQEVIVCESMIDALTAWAYGSYAVAFNGLGSDLQFKQLRELPCRTLILSTDNDEYGMRARDKIRQQVRNKIIMEYILPEGKKDLNELSKSEFEALQKIF